MSKTFSDYGKEFQEKFVQALITDARFSEQMLEVFLPEYVEVKHLQFLADRYFQYARKYRVFPSLKLLITIIRDDLKNETDIVLKERIVAYIKQIRTNPNPEDLPWVKEKALDFCKKQALKEALEKSVELIATDKYESIVEVIKTAVLVGTAPSLGHNLIEDVDSRFERFLRNCVPTGFEELDKKGVFNGGVANGELSVILSTSGAGKSHWLVQLGANAIKLGLNVVHYTFELSEPNVGMRYDSYLCEIDVDDLIENKKEVQGYYEKNKDKLGKLIIKFFPTNYASVFTLKSHIERLSLSGVIPHLIIVDYADVMRSSRKFESLRHELRQVYEDLRGLAGEMSIPLWTACFEGDTKIECPFGVFKIKDMVGKSGFPVYSYNHETDKIELKTVKSVYLSNTNADVMKLTLDNGKSVIATPSHKFMKRDGTYEELQNLKEGDSLMPLRLDTDEKGWDSVVQNDMSEETVSDMLDIWRAQRTEQILKQRREAKKDTQKDINDKINKTKFGDKKEERIKQHIEIVKICKSRKEFIFRTYHIPLDHKLKCKIWEDYNHKVVSIESVSEKVAVYNMEVEDLHNYALNCGIVVKNSQSNREGIDADILDASNVSEAYGKVMTADIILSISRKTQEKSVGTGRLFVVKNRAGRDGLLFPLTINTARSKFEIGEQTTEQITDVRKSEEIEQKRRMKEKWNELTRSGKLKLSAPDVKDDSDDNNEKNE